MLDWPECTCSHGSVAQAGARAAAEDSRELIVLISNSLHNGLHDPPDLFPGKLGKNRKGEGVFRGEVRMRVIQILCAEIGETFRV